MLAVSKTPLSVGSSMLAKAGAMLAGGAWVTSYSVPDRACGLAAPQWDAGWGRGCVLACDRALVRQRLSNPEWTVGVGCGRRDISILPIGQVQKDRRAIANANRRITDVVRAHGQHGQS